MGRAGRILLIATILSVLVFFYAFVSAQLSAVLEDITIEPAQNRASTFESLREALRRGDLAGSQYRDMDGDEASDYAFITYTVRLEGYSLLPAEWAVLSLSPLPGDIVLIQGPPQDAPSFGGCLLSATLLTSAQEAESARSLWAEYYVLGRAHSATVRGY